MKRRSAAEMVNRCFRHQHPEAYGHAAAAEGAVPQQLRYGPGEVYDTTTGIGEEPMGNPDHIPIDGYQEVVPTC